VTSFTSKLIPTLRVVRVLNSLTVFAATFIGGLISGGGQLHTVAAASATMFFGAAFGYALNDYYDAPSDELNRPDRPIPSGALSARSVLVVSFVCLSVALLFAVALTPPLRLAVVGAGVLVWLYNARLKRTGLLGNVLVSLLAGFTLVFGGLSAGEARHTLFPALLAFLLHLPREVLKDVQDVEGDSRRGVRGLAAVLGKPFAARLASLLLLVLVTVSFVPYAAGYYGELYAGIVVLLDALLVWNAVTLWSDVSERSVRSAVRLLKLAMFLGLLAVGLGRL
jgi:geranylgeranylglycerol-phosphate geranylgeranyltransferase